MRDVYPRNLSSRYSDYTNANSLREAQFNVEYLHELGLIKKPHAGHYATTLMASESPPPDSDAYISGLITARGIDFLEDDGGLSAILGTVTVKLHADTIRDLIDAKITESKAIPEQEKPALREALKGIRDEGLKQLTTKLISHGLDQGAITALQLREWLNI